jgi:hypothetical protein
MSGNELYRKQRQKMRTGDRLEWRSDTVIGRLIRLVTRQRVNHTGMVIRFGSLEILKDIDLVCTAEALEDGFHIQRLSRRLDGHRGQVWWHRLKARHLASSPLMGSWALSFAGIEYDFKSLFKQAVARVTASPELLFCSEAIFLVGKKAGLPVSPDIQVAPQPGEDMDRLGWWEKGERIL